jgi:exopolyphosphatase/guanosine-5'-triphosphate,3'-diphosphate pyrophosphatase
MKGAVIDLGTNTFGLIVFEEKASQRKILITDKSFVNLGEGGINYNFLTKKAMERAYFAIDHFVDTCRSFGVYPEQIRAFGTSALRDAKNAQEFLDEIYKLHNLKVLLINGKDEADFVYQGVQSIHSFGKGLSCIMDIGGGSTEFTVTKSKIVQEQKSFNIGISRITQLFELSDPLSPDDINRIKLFLEYQTKGYFETLTVDDLIGAAGSFETYFLLLNKTSTYDSQKTHLLPLKELNEALDDLIHSTFAERDKNYWIVDYRKDMINVAAYKTKWVLDQIGASACYFSPAGLKEGVIASAFKK